MLKKGDTPKHIPEMIDFLLRVEDPATVGLRKILKKKRETDEDFPLQAMALEELDKGAASQKRVFSETERRILELEKAVIELKNKLALQKSYTEKAVRDAYNSGAGDGLQKGEKAGYEKAKTEYNARVKEIEERLVTVFQSIESSRTSFLLAAHNEVLKIAHCIARKIIDTQISIDGDIVLTVIKKALSYLSDRQEYTIKVSPDDITTVTQKKEFWTSIADHLDKIKITEDSRIEKGGCIIESQTGIVDARISVQMDELNEVINAAWDSMLAAGSSQTKIVDKK
jgi:flagellar assembly protein FliH